MKLGDIKLAALELMLPNETGVDEDTLDSTTDENVLVYVNKMPLVINRCFADLEAKKVLKTKDYILTAQNATYDEEGEIYSGDTPTLVFRFTENVANYDSVSLIFSQNDEAILTKTKTAFTFGSETIDDVTVYYAQLTLTSAETSSFSTNDVIEMQFTFTNDSEVSHSNIAVTNVQRILEDDDD